MGGPADVSEIIDNIIKRTFEGRWSLVHSFIKHHMDLSQKAKKSKSSRKHEDSKTEEDPQQKATPDDDQSMKGLASYTQHS